MKKNVTKKRVSLSSPKLVFRLSDKKKLISTHKNGFSNKRKMHKLFFILIKYQN